MAIVSCFFGIGFSMFYANWRRSWIRFFFQQWSRKNPYCIEFQWQLFEPSVRRWCRNFELDQKTFIIYPPSAKFYYVKLPLNHYIYDVPVASSRSINISDHRVTWPRYYRKQKYTLAATTAAYFKVATESRVGAWKPVQLEATESFIRINLLARKFKIIRFIQMVRHENGIIVQWCHNTRADIFAPKLL